MIIYVIAGKSDDHRLNYTLDFILRTLGYDFTIVDLGATIPEKSFILSYLDDKEIPQLNNDCVIHIFKSGQIHALDELEKNINLFDCSEIALPILGKQLTSPKKGTWRFRKTDGYFGSKGRTDWYVGFDLFANVFYHLSRYEEKWRHFAEETATDHSTSILSRYQQLKVPVVDVLLEYIDRLIIKKATSVNLTLLKILNWPTAEEFGVALTHDVDLTRGVSIKEKIINKGMGIIQTLTGDHERRQHVKSEMDARDEICWSYPHIISFYDKHNWHSTFFFLTKIFEGVHIRYNISSKKFRKLVSNLQNNGHEIALHSSLKAFDKRGRYKEEKERLETILSHSCSGLRQHYLRAKYPRLWKLAEHAGFSYDSSLSYNYQAGFRAGTSHPFRTYEYDEDRIISVIEFSLLCFENNLPMDDQPEKVINGLIEQVARFHGIFVALWHPSNFMQEPFISTWNSMIAELKKRRIYINTLSGHLGWYLGRSQLKILPESHKALVKNPAGVQNFSVQIIGNNELIGSDGAEIERLSKGIYSLKTKRKQLSLSFSR
jgi:peptidoglycan/xylan/chitin deacetylase (PgdA/CDA1 family)